MDATKFHTTKHHQVPLDANTLNRRPRNIAEHDNTAPSSNDTPIELFDLDEYRLKENLAKTRRKRRITMRTR